MLMYMCAKFGACITECTIGLLCCPTIITQFVQAGCSSGRPTNSVKALKATAAAAIKATIYRIQRKTQPVYTALRALFLLSAAMLLATSAWTRPLLSTP